VKHFEYKIFHLDKESSLKSYFLFKIAIPFSISAEDMRQYHVRFLFKQRHSNDGKVAIFILTFLNKKEFLFSQR
jgi:hypothetical protein